MSVEEAQKPEATHTETTRIVSEQELHVMYLAKYDCSNPEISIESATCLPVGTIIKDHKEYRIEPYVNATAANGKINAIAAEGFIIEQILQSGDGKLAILFSRSVATIRTADPGPESEEPTINEGDRNA